MTNATGNPVENARASAGESVLVCLVGLSPAVLTETVWALASGDEPIVPDRVIAITTSRGRDVLQKRLFEEGGWLNLVDHLSARFGNTLRAPRFGPVDDCVRVFPNAARSAPLEDIRSQADNDAVAEYLLEALRAFTENDNVRLIASIAGGRKTTGALLHSVMALIGRAGDRIHHVLVDEPWERLPGFLFPGCPGGFAHPDTGEPLDSASAGVALAEVPFVPLRYLFKREIDLSADSYLRLVRHLRARALDPEQDLAADLWPREGLLRINRRRIDLSPREFALYLQFALSARDEGGARIGALDDLPPDALHTVAREHRDPDDLSQWAHRVLESPETGEEDIRKLLSSIRAKLRRAGCDGLAVERAVPRRGRLSIDLPEDQIRLHPSNANPTTPQTPTGHD